jgi:phosphotriesterase-related protein
MIRTVQGDLARDQLGVTLVHEHLLNKAGCLIGDPDANLDEADVISAELGDAMSHGLRTLVEVSTFEMTRDIVRTLDIVKLLGLNLVLSTGFFCADFVPENIRRADVDSLFNAMLHDLCGEEALVPRAGVIGEIGISPNGPTLWELHIHEAAALAHRQTGCPVITHTFDGAQAAEQAQMLIKFGVRPSAVLICHVDADRPIEDHLVVLRSGVFVSLDRIGDHRRCDDEARARRVMELFSRGYGDRVVLSHDLARRSRLKTYGGHGYGHLLTSFLPRLRRLGLDQNSIDQLTIHNPACFLDWKLGEEL